MMPRLILILALYLVLSNGVEAACPLGWKTFQNSCYQIFPGPKSWNAARQECVKSGGVLAEVESQAENNFIQKTFAKKAWIGITRCHDSATCLAGSFQEVKYVNWANNEPNNEPKNSPNLENGQFAVVVNKAGKWKDEPKTNKFPFICENSADPCTGNYCNLDESTCVGNPDGTYKCDCRNGFSGEYCYVEPCDAYPCKNGGMCKHDPAQADGYKCNCINFYSGKNCEVTPPCQQKPCKNGKCTNLDAKYKCTCNTGWTGTNCDVRPCDSSPCVTGRICQNVGNGYKCVCRAGWTGPNCETDGSGNGDPHYTTFDGKRYDFMGKCEYIYAKDCGSDHAFEVLQQNEPCGGGGRVSCTKSIRVLVKSFEIVMQRRATVYVNGQNVKLPWQQQGILLNSYYGGASLKVPDLLFSVFWNGYMGITVRINQRYHGEMCGLMGNADKNPNNDFQLPDKTPTTNIGLFGNSWKKNPKCVNGFVPPDPCKSISVGEKNGIVAKCAKMKTGPFKPCISIITPDITYIPNCEYDLCAMKGNPSAAWCQSLETYARACNAKGVTIPWEGTPDFHECGNPCADVPCSNGGACQNIDSKNYKCTCLKGYTGLTCNDVECPSGYHSHGDSCYKKMTRRPWRIARCSGDDEFVYGKNEDENGFIYKTFVQEKNKPFWMNAVVCGASKLCKNDFTTVLSHNFAGGAIPDEGCAAMTVTKKGKWERANCRTPYDFICKHVVFQNNEAPIVPA